MGLKRPQIPTLGFSGSLGQGDLCLRLDRPAALLLTVQSASPHGPKAPAGHFRVVPAVFGLHGIRGRNSRPGDRAERGDSRVRRRRGRRGNKGVLSVASGCTPGPGLNVHALPGMRQWVCEYRHGDSKRPRCRRGRRVSRGAAESGLLRPAGTRQLWDSDGAERDQTGASGEEAVGGLVSLARVAASTTGVRRCQSADAPNSDPSRSDLVRASWYSHLNSTGASLRSMSYQSASHPCSSTP